MATLPKQDTKDAWGYLFIEEVALRMPVRNSGTDRQGRVERRDAEVEGHASPLDLTAWRTEGHTPMQPGHVLAEPALAGQAASPAESPDVQSPWSTDEDLSDIDS